MGKAVGLLPSWYWPEGVQRYLRAPRVALYELTVSRWARRYGSDEALAGDGAILNFRELDQACAAVAANYIARLAAGSGRVALAVRSPASFVPLFLGLLRADATVLLLDGVSAEGAQAALAEFQPELLIGDDASLSVGSEVKKEEPAALLEATAPGAPTASVDPTRASIALPGRSGLLWHSHMSVMSGATAFAEFIGLKPPERLLVARPQGSWEGLIGLLAPLQLGAAALLGSDGDPEATASLLRRYSPSALWMGGAAAADLLDRTTALTNAVRETKTSLLLTTTSPFPKPLRRALRRRLGTPVLTVYGYPETGAIVAAHPSWYLDEAIGIPMTGVDIIALSPRTGEPVEPPWELLSYAGIGVKTHALATNVPTVGKDESEGVDSRCYNTGDLGVIDANGMLFLLG